MAARATGMVRTQLRVSDIVAVTIATSARKVEIVIGIGLATHLPTHYHHTTNASVAIASAQTHRPVHQHQGPTMPPTSRRPTNEGPLVVVPSSSMFSRRAHPLHSPARACQVGGLGGFRIGAAMNDHFLYYPSTRRCLAAHETGNDYACIQDDVD